MRCPRCGQVKRSGYRWCGCYELKGGWILDLVNQTMAEATCPVVETPPYVSRDVGPIVTWTDEVPEVRAALPPISWRTIDAVMEPEIETATSLLNRERWLKLTSPTPVTPAMEKWMDEVCVILEKHILEAWVRRGRQLGKTGLTLGPVVDADDYPPWVECRDGCGSLWCQLHDLHAFECPCELEPDQ